MAEIFANQVILFAVKKVMMNHGIYDGELDETWDAKEKEAWRNVCGKLGYVYTPTPDIVSQTPANQKRLSDLVEQEQANHTIIKPVRIKKSLYRMVKALSPGVADIRLTNEMSEASLIVQEEQRQSLDPELSQSLDASHDEAEKARRASIIHALRKAKKIVRQSKKEAVETGDTKQATNKPKVISIR